MPRSDRPGARRTYVGEMEWALNRAYGCNNDRNPNRMAQVSDALRYGMSVAIARRSREPIPPRPDLSRSI